MKLNRRSFIVKLSSWLGGVTILINLPPLLKTNMACASQEINKRMISFDGMSLREIVRKKLHHGNPKFINPFKRFRKKRFLDLLKWKLGFNNPYEPEYDLEEVTPVSIDWKPVTEHNGLSVTYINHSSLLIRDKGATFLIDPIFFGLMPFIKNFTPLEFDPAEMPAPDHILITHGHYDHLDKDSLEVFDKKTHIISPLGYEGEFSSIGMKNRTELDWYSAWTDGKREVILLPVNHWTMRNPLFGPNKSLWGGFLIRTKTGPTLFFSGDTAYCSGFKEIGKEFNIDLAVFNLGAYAPRWFMKESHINPSETLTAMEDLGAKQLIPVHWGTFRLGDEPVFKPPQDLMAEAKKRQLEDRVVILNHGNTLYL